MSKLLPILVLLPLASAALIGFYTFYPNSQNSQKVQGTQEEKRVLLIADSNIAVTTSGATTKASATDSTLPKFYGESNNPNLNFVAALTTELTVSDFQVASVRVLDTRSIGVYTQQGAVAIFSTENDLKSQIDSLQIVLAKSKIDAAKIEKIDLRFDKPVVTYN